MKSILAAALIAAAAIASAQSFVRAQFIFFRSNDGKTIYNPPRQLVLTSKEDLAKLVKFLPGVGMNQGGLKPGGWEGWGTVRLMRSKGPGVQVFFPGDGKVYSMVARKGDFPAGKGFREYLLEMEKKAKQ